MDTVQFAPAIPSFALQKPQTVHLALVLDRSGSMESCREATIAGFNRYLAGVSEFVVAENLPATGSLTVFSDSVAMDPFMASLQTVRPLTPQTYVPDGCTALLDAVGSTVERLESATGGGKDDAFLVCIVSDGYENASHRYSAEGIARTISRLTELGNWTFTYLGANQDLSQVVEDLNIPEANVAAYDATADGTDSAWEGHARSTIQHLGSRQRSSRSFYKEGEGTEGE